MVACTVASRSGVLVRSGAALEKCRGVTAVCFDKTGTLTSGDLTVERIVFSDQDDVLMFPAVPAAAFSSSRLRLVDLLLTAACQSDHPISRAIAAAVRAGACVDHHMCDQLPIFMSMANGPSRIRVQPLSEHARSACAVASQFTGAVFHVEDDTNGCVVLSCTPPPKSTQIDGAAGGVARAQAK